jgi:hypothetical protein
MRDSFLIAPKAEELGSFEYAVEELEEVELLAAAVELFAPTVSRKLSKAMYFLFIIKGCIFLFRGIFFLLEVFLMFLIRINYL